MNLSQQTGLFGKLPAHGDFIHRNLASGFITSWDDWLQHFVAGSREQLGEDWLNIYLTSPIWRFVFSAGVIDANCWAGIMMPSVDRVGRYFPFTVASRLPAETSPVEFINLQTGWYTEIESLALQALDGQLMIDDLAVQLKNTELQAGSNYRNAARIMENNTLLMDMPRDEQSPASVYPHMLETLLQKNFNSYSVWSTRGSERIRPCVFFVQGLPAVSQVPAMLDGQWNQWGWPQPRIPETV